MAARPFSPPRVASALLFAGLLLAGCKLRAHDGDGNVTASISLDPDDAGHATSDKGRDTHSVSIDVPGFSASVKVPDLALGSDTTHIDNLKTYPGTSIHGVKVLGRSAGEGDVEMNFTAPADGAKLLAWYRDEATREGWTIVPATGDNQFEATHSEDGDRTTHLAIRIGADGNGSSGRFLVAGH